jgi:molybdate transport system regulatory protein
VFCRGFATLIPAMKARTAPRQLIKPNFRIYFGDEVALGPGKAELLAHLDQTGSISAAARRMGMSYNRAWSLIQTMNRCFREPVVVTTRGGRKRGGASLTQTGKRLVNLYQRLEADYLSATEATRNKLASLLKRNA